MHGGEKLLLIIMSGFPHTSNWTRVSQWAKTAVRIMAPLPLTHILYMWNMNRVLGHTSPTSADLFEIVAISHSKFKRPSSQTSIPSPERLLLCKRMTVSCRSQEWLALSYSASGFHLDN